MVKINLRKYYSTLYDVDSYCIVSEPVKTLLDEFNRSEHAQNERIRYHSARLLYIDGVTESEIQIPVLTLEEQYFKELLQADLYRAMLKLPEKQLRRIYAHFFIELSITQIAHIEHISVAAVSNSIKHGILTLRRYLKQV